MTTKPPKIGIDETAYASNQGTIQTDGTQPSETNSYPRHSDSVNGTYPGEPEEKRLKRLSETNETLLKVPHLQSHELDTLSSPSHNPNYTPTLDSGEEWDRVDFLIKEHNVYAGENMGLFVAKLKSLLQESREEERQRVVEMIEELRKTKRFHSTDNDFSALAMQSGYLFAISDLQSKLEKV